MTKSSSTPTHTQKQSCGCYVADFLRRVKLKTSSNIPMSTVLFYSSKQLQAEVESLPQLTPQTEIPQLPLRASRCYRRRQGLPWQNQNFSARTSLLWGWGTIDWRCHCNACELMGLACAICTGKLFTNSCVYDRPKHKKTQKSDDKGI